MRANQEWESATPCDAIAHAQQTIAWARHLVIVFPLWLGDMPALLKAFFYRLYYRAHSVKSLERNILAFCGIAPVRTMLIGTIDSKDRGAGGVWLTEVSVLGRDGR